MYKMDLALINLQWLILHETKPFYCNRFNDKKIIWRVDKFTYLGSSVSSTEKRHRHTPNESMESYR